MLSQEFRTQIRSECGSEVEIGPKGRQKVDRDGKIGLKGRREVDPDSKIGLKARWKGRPGQKVCLEASFVGLAAVGRLERGPGGWPGLGRPRKSRRREGARPDRKIMNRLYYNII